MIRTILILLPFALVLAGCGDKDNGGGANQPDGDEGQDEHAHAAKHGGTLLELGAHEGFLEVKMDHDAGKVTVWAYLGEEMADTKLAEAPVMNFKADDKPTQLKAEPNADGSWVFESDTLKGEPEGARFRVVLGGKTYSPKWDHEHSHEGHDHDDDDDGHDHDDGDEHEGHDHDEDGHEKDGHDEDGN